MSGDRPVEPARSEKRFFLFDRKPAEKRHERTMNFRPGRPWTGSRAASKE